MRNGIDQKKFISINLFFVLYIFIIFQVKLRFCYMLAYNKLIDSMFGLPDITIIVVGATVIVVIAALLYWGITFKGHD